MLSNGNFWAGLVVGILAYWAWMRYQARKSAK